MDGQRKVAGGIAAAVRRNGFDGKGDCAVRYVLLARRVVGVGHEGIVERAVAVRRPEEDSRLASRDVDFEVGAFADVGFFVHFDGGSLMETDHDIIGEGLAFFIGGGEGQGDGFVS